MSVNKNLGRNLDLVLVIILTLTLLIPFASKTGYAIDNKENYNYYSIPKNYETANEYYKDYNNNNGEQYYYNYPLKDKADYPKAQIQDCKECFFSELEKLDNKVVYKILYEIDIEFGDIEELCRLIANERIDRDQLEQILTRILTNIDYNLEQHNTEYSDQHYNNNNENVEVDLDAYSFYNNDNEYNEYSYKYDYNYKLEEQTKRQIVQNIIDCLFESISTVLVVWQDNTFGNFDIFISKSTDGGETFSTPENISNNDGNSVFPSIAVYENNVYVVWTDDTFGNPDIFIAKSTNGGETFSTPENISNNDGVSTFPRIAVNENNVYVVWQDGTDTPGSREIFIAKSINSGETFSTPENISNNKGLSLSPQIAISDDNVYVVWSDDTDGFDKIFLSKSGDGGETFSTPENISDQELESDTSFAYQPSITVNENNVYVVWHEDPQGERSIFISKSTDGGETFSTPENLSDKFDFSSKSAVAVDGDNIYVAWIVDIPKNNDVFLSKSTDGGETFSTPENISNNDGFSNIAIRVISTAFEPSIAITGNHVYITWTDGSPGNWEILLAKGTNNDDPLSHLKNLSNNNGESQEPELAVLQ